MPFLHCKNKRKRAQNVQNSEFTYYASKSVKWIKQTPTPSFWGDVGMKKWSQCLDSGTRSPILAKVPIFRRPKMGLRVPKLINRFFNLATRKPSRCLFYSFTTFGRVIGKFWILNILSSFLQCKKGIFYKMVARRRKCPKNHFFAFLVYFHIDTTYIKLDWNSDNFLIFWSTLLNITL